MPSRPDQNLYSPGNFTALRKDIFDQALKAVGESFPVENDNYMLTLEGVEYDGGIPEYSKRDQKAAVYNNKSLSASIRGRWALTDKATGKVVSKSSLRKLMDVPYLTERGTFIRNGSEVTLPIQMRLVPGVYAVMGENGEAKAQINTQPGTGRAMQLTMNPANPVFRLKVGTRNYNLYPILKHAGVKDTTLQEAWGKEIFDANYKDFIKGGGWYSGGDKDDVEGENPYDRIAKDVFGGKIDPINAKMTFGEAFDTVDPNVLTRTASRLLALTRGEIDSDNRDSLENQRFVMAPEMIAERIRKDAGGTVRNLLWKATRDGNVDRLPPSALSRYIHSLFTDSGLSQVIEETNLLDAYQRATKVTRMGEGGISSIDSAPMSSRMVHNTYKGFIDPVSSPESLRVGLDTQAAIGVLKGNDGLIYSPLINAVSGRKEMVSSIESSTVPVAFAEYRNSPLEVIPTMVGNSFQYLPRKDIKYFVPNGDSLFSLSSNMVPMKAGIKAGRLLMAQKHQTQAMSLSDRMAPYVQTMDPDGEDTTVEQKYGTVMGAVKADQGGQVLDVKEDEVVVRQDDGTKRTYSLYHNFPLNRRSLVTNVPTVTKGDVIKPGQLIASSNYTDKNGTSALGTQLRTGWLSYKGYNNLDGIVISDSAAKRLTSEYLYHHDKDKEEGVQFGKDIFAGAFPTKFTKTQLDTIADNGAAKPGTILQKGDPILLAMSKRVPGPQTLYRTLSKDSSVVWENEFPGKVIDTVDTKDGIKVFTEAQVPAQVGDKISTRFASKGTIALILPDEKMPRNQAGEHLQVLLSPTGIVSRVNSAQLVEAALGKVAAKTGKTYKLPGFMDESLVDFAEQELKAAGLEDKEDLIDPETGNIIPQIKTGNSYIVKFHHTSESKEGARSTGGYSADEQPSGVGHDSAKTLGGLLLGAFVGHDSSEILKDMKLVKGQRNDEFWRDFRSGRTPHTPSSPLIYDKFLAHLEGAGIKVNRDGDDTNIFAMTNDDVKEFTKGEVTTADTFTDKTFTPAKGGLFDPAIFGPNGDQWGYIKLEEPLPNPVMEDVIKVLLNVTEDEYRGILGGVKKLPDGSTGAEGLKQYLSKINPKVGLANALQVVRSGKGAKRDKAIKQLRYYSAMDKQGVTPDAFMLDRIPVLPPRFRRVTESGGMMMIPDANYLYKAMMDTAEDYKQAKEAKLPTESLAAGRLGLYDSFKAVTGLGEPTIKALQEKEVGGLLKWVFGKGSPKFGGFQRSVVGGKLDVTGRAVVDIDPELRIDEVGLPEGQAWGLYKDFTIRKLVQAGMPVFQATKEVVNKTDRAKEMVKRVMAERPLIMTRAPALHKFSVMAFKPKMIEGHTLMVNPVVAGPFNLDVDGDSMQTMIKLYVEHKTLKEMLDRAKTSGKVEAVTPNKKETAMLSKKEKPSVTGIVASIEDIPVVDGTEVWLDDRRTEWDVIDGVYVNALDRDTCTQGIFKVTKKSLHRDIPMWDVQLGQDNNFPKVITCSEDRSLVTYHEGNIVTSTPEESLGRLVPKIVPDASTTPDKCIRYAKWGVQIPLTREVGEFIGALIGDGWVDIANQARVASNYPELQEFLVSVAGKYFPQTKDALISTYKTDRWGDENSSRVNLHFTKEVSIALRNAIGSGAANKRIPFECLCGSRAHLEGLLAGLMDTDGTFTYAVLKGGKVNRGISYETTSPYLRDCVVDLCAKLGIRTSVVAYRGASSTMDCYRVSMSTTDFSEFVGRSPAFVLHQKGKTERMKRVISTEGNVMAEGKADRVPYPTHLLSELAWARLSLSAPMRSHYMKVRDLPRSTALSMVEELITLDWSKYIQPSAIEMSRRTNRTPAEAFRLVMEWCDLVTNNTLKWEKITKVAFKGREDAWDLTVPGPLTFVTSDGFVVQDTVTYYVPVSKKAVKDAYAKMMPSKNLLSARNFTAHYMPQEEYILGAYLSTRKGTGPVKRTFKTEQEAIQAYKRGEIDVNDNVQITG